ncbi:hypothetical protein ACCP96_22170 [Xanthomonas campestris pv. fici]|uniref:PD-(D/E)XK nuclease domain-containing protein n=1 Tax=Xanthomonas euvesicatoria TaxID=456327 RepID=UPI003559083F
MANRTGLGKRGQHQQLVCFIYDPEGRIGNPVGLERDLEKTLAKMPVRVIVGPKGT